MSRVSQVEGASQKATASKALIVAEFACPDRAAQVAEATRAFAKSSTLGTAQGNALARHLAEVGDTSLYPRAPFHQAALRRAGEIDQWVDFGLTEVLSRASALASSSPKNEKDNAALIRSLAVLDAHLRQRTYIVGEAVSLAEVALVSDLLIVFEKILDPQDREKLPHLTRWFLTVSSIPPFAAVLGCVALCKGVSSSGKSTALANGTREAQLDGAQKQKGGQKEGTQKQKHGGKSKQDAKAKGAAAGAAAAALGVADSKKKPSQLGIVAKKNEDFADWYTQVCTFAEMISYYDVSGCYILRPWAYSVWERIQAWFDSEIKKIGVENACFPLFVTEDALNKEKDHVEGFAAEVAWVTRSGKSELQRPIAIRPTSETVIYPYYALWIRSWRDLPLKLNQWTNVVRWEFSNPTPFIRTREFLWQEGHTAYATREEADEDVYTILDLYAKVYTDLLAVPVTKGFKSKAEQFAGSLYSTSIEGFVETTGRGIQCGTSHALGQNFSKMFGIEFEDQDKTSRLVWQNSWGLSTRSIGVMIMVHGDDKGLVMPPRVAPVQVVVVPIPNSKLSKEVTDSLMDKVEEFVQQLKQAGIRVKSDTRDIYTPGWKYSHWETKGVPIRLALGIKDMEKETVEVARRDTGAKEFVAWVDMLKRVPELLSEIQSDMYTKAAERYEACKEVAHTWDEFMAALNRKHMVLAPWCDEPEVEKKVKVDSTGIDAQGIAQMGAKTLCIPLQQPYLPAGTKCFKTGQPAKNWALWGRSY